MSIKFTNLSKIFLVAGITSVFALPAQAEMKPLDEKFEDAYFSYGKNAFVQSNALSQIDTILGFTGFPDQHINRDAKAVDKIYQEGMAKQSSMGLRILTRDLANPYDTSIRESPSYSAIK